jgi:hypothetical protein
LSYKWGGPINFIWKASFLCFLVFYPNVYWVMYFEGRDKFIRLRTSNPQGGLIFSDLFECCHTS